MATTYIFRAGSTYVGAEINQRYILADAVDKEYTLVSTDSYGVSRYGVADGMDDRNMQDTEGTIKIFKAGSKKIERRLNVYLPRFPRRLSGVARMALARFLLSRNENQEADNEEFVMQRFAYMLDDIPQSVCIHNTGSRAIELQVNFYEEVGDHSQSDRS